MLGVLVWSTTLAAAGAADTYPTKPIVLVSWSAAGSPVDVMAREIAKLSQKYMNVPMVVEDKTGADGGIALSFISSEPADGYTLLALTSSLTVTLNTSLKDKFKQNQFSFLGTVETDPYVIAVRTESPFKTFADFANATKTQPNITIAGPFAESAESFFARKMGNIAKIKFNWVPFNGGSSAVTAGLGGHVDAVCSNVSGVSSLVKSGQMRVLAVSGTESNPQLPGTPTFASLGYKSLDGTHWRGVMARSGLPPAVEAKLNAFLRQVASDPEFVQYVRTSGLLPFYNDHQQSEKLVTSDMSSIAQQIAAGISK